MKLCIFLVPYDPLQQLQDAHPQPPGLPSELDHDVRPLPALTQGIRN